MSALEDMANTCPKCGHDRRGHYAGVGQAHNPATVQNVGPAGQQRKARPHDCERCGRHMEWDDQQCGCSARDPWLQR